MSGAPVRIPAPAAAGAGAPALDVCFCDGPSGLERALGERDRVAVIGGLHELVSAARAVGAGGSVLAVPRAAGVPAEDHSLDAVVLATPAAASRPRGVLLGEVGRVLRSGGRLVVVQGASA